MVLGVTTIIGCFAIQMLLDALLGLRVKPRY